MLSKAKLQEAAKRNLDQYDEEMIGNLIDLTKQELTTDLGKEEAEEIATEVEDYIEDMIVEEVDQDTWDAIYLYLTQLGYTIDVDTWDGIHQSWDPQDPDEWAYEAAMSDYDASMDDKYDEMKDARMGI